MQLAQHADDLAIPQDFCRLAGLQRRMCCRDEPNARGIGRERENRLDICFYVKEVDLAGLGAPLFRNHRPGDKPADTEYFRVVFKRAVIRTTRFEKADPILLSCRVGGGRRNHARPQ